MGYLWDIYGISMGHLRYDDIRVIVRIQRLNRPKILKTRECREKYG